MSGPYTCQRAAVGSAELFCNSAALNLGQMKSRSLPEQGCATRYRKLYARSAYLSGEYPEKMTKLLAELRARYGLEGNRGEVPAAARHPQMALPFSSPPSPSEASLPLTAYHNAM